VIKKENIKLNEFTTPITINNKQISTEAIQIQQFTRFDMNVRIANINGVPYICYNDICNAIDSVNNNMPRFTSQLDYEYNLVISNGMNPGPAYYKYLDVQTSQGVRQILFVSEGAFYRIVLRSNSDKALLFQHWVCDEVLPKLRQISSGSQEAVNDMLNLILAKQKEVLCQMNLYTDHMDCSYSDTKDMLESVHSEQLALKENLDQFKEEFRLCRHVDTEGYIN
jgi:prophage antirepressor-like protein